MLSVEVLSMSEAIPPQPENGESRLSIEVPYEAFVPGDFRRVPVEYFESEGVGIKRGDWRIAPDGSRYRDMTSVKDFPVWRDLDGNELRCVAKRVDAEKGEVAASGDPFYEYRVMEAVAARGLPVAKVVARAEQDGVHLIVMEKVLGLRWKEAASIARERKLSEEAVAHLLEQAEAKMKELAARFEEAGIHRSWKLQDMIFDINWDTLQVHGMTPTDWERTVLSPAA